MGRRRRDILSPSLAKRDEGDFPADEHSIMRLLINGIIMELQVTTEIPPREP
jgi:hypothetical protein